MGCIGVYLLNAKCSVESEGISVGEGHIMSQDMLNRKFGSFNRE